MFFFRKILLILWHTDFVQFFVPAKYYSELEYKRYMKKKLNLKNPQTFNEKLQWLKLYDKNPLYTKLADKYEVRQYIKERIGEKYLVPIIGIYNGVDEIPFSDLPQEYVLKCTHDSGTVVIKNSHNTYSISQIKKILCFGMKRNYYYTHREWCYKYIRPRIICEQLIRTNDNQPPRDYKIFCFDGEPQFLFVASDRGRGTKFDFFDMDWNKYPVMQHYPNSEYSITRPAAWDEMIVCARKLSSGLPHVRVDFYIDREERIFVGELTLCHFGGFEKFEPDYYDEYFGKFLTLPVKNMK